MDPLAMGIIAVVVVGVAYWVFFRQAEDVETPEPPKAKPVGKPVAPAKAGLPGDADLNKLTKAKLEELGREFGVELDKRKTKANMITDLKAQAK